MKQDTLRDSIELPVKRCSQCSSNLTQIRRAIACDWRVTPRLFECIQIGRTNGWHHLQPTYDSRRVHDAHHAGGDHGGRTFRRHRYGRERYQRRSACINALKDNLHWSQLGYVVFNAYTRSITLRYKLSREITERAFLCKLGHK